MPLASVEEAIVYDPAGARSFEGREVMTVRGATLPVCSLARLFGHTTSSPPPRGFVVVTSVGNRRVGFVVDGLIGQQDIGIKALGRTLRGARGFAGATELGDQRVALVLDASTLVEDAFVGYEKLGERFAGRLPA